MRGPTFSVKLGLGPGFSGGSKYSVTPGFSSPLRHRLFQIMSFIRPTVTFGDQFDP